MSNLATMERFFEAFTGGDVPGCIALMHPDVDVHEPPGLPYGGEYHGLEEFQALLGTILGDYEMVVKKYRLGEVGDTVVALIDAWFKHRGTGQESDMRTVEIYTLADGLITDIELYYWNPQTIRDLAAE